MIDDNARQLLSRNLKQFRDQAGLTQMELATAAGVGIATVNRAEKGRRVPDTSTLVSLAGALGRTLDDLFAETPAPPDPAKQPAVRFRLLQPMDDDLAERIRMFQDSINREYRERVFKEQQRLRRGKKH